MDEYELIDQALAGNEPAFNQLVIQHKNLVYHIIFSFVKDPYIIDDLAQEIMIKVFTRLASFRRESRFSTWIGRIAYNHCINHLRRERMKPEFLPIPIDYSFTFSEPQFIKSEDRLKNLIVNAVEQLPPHYRLIIRLFHFDNLTYYDISEVLGISEGTIKSRLFRARMILKDLLIELKNEAE